MANKSNPDLIKFIKEARRRGFEDSEIRNPLLKQGWPRNEIESAFNEIKKQTGKRGKSKREYSGAKVQLRINLDKKVYAILDRRARKNLLSAEEQAEDIIRRSAAISLKRVPKEERLDDLLVSLFSRKRRK